MADPVPEPDISLSDLDQALAQVKSKPQGEGGKGGDAQQGEDQPLPIATGLHPEDAEAEVSVKGNELAAHLKSEEAFESFGLSELVLKGVYDKKFVRPSQIQARTLPAILSGKNVIGQAQTGSGKTACFALGMLHRADTNIAATQCLCLAHVRELAFQLHNDTMELGKYLQSLRSAVLVPRFRADVANAHLVFGTPGTVLERIKRRELDLSALRMFVIDEADHMVSLTGLGDQTKKIFKSVPKAAQVLLFSATYEDERVRQLALKLVAEPRLEVLVKRSELTLEGIRQFVVKCASAQQKFEVLDDIFGLLTIGQTIIFAKRKVDVDMLKRNLEEKGHTVSALHGSLEHEERDAVMGAFRSGQSKVLVTTNVLARGIDILQVTLTVNYDLPEDENGQPDSETYLHRSGRAARFGRKGVTLNMVDGPRSQRALDVIANHWGQTIQELNPDDIEDTLGAALKKIAS